MSLRPGEASPVTVCLAPLVPAGALIGYIYAHIDHIYTYVKYIHVSNP